MARPRGARNVINLSLSDRRRYMKQLRDKADKGDVLSTGLLLFFSKVFNRQMPSDFEEDKQE